MTRVKTVKCVVCSGKIHLMAFHVASQFGSSKIRKKSMNVAPQLLEEKGQPIVHKMMGFSTAKLSIKEKSDSQLGRCRLASLLTPLLFPEAFLQQLLP